jgi:hypothetical protein
VNERLGTAFREAAKQVGVTVSLHVVPADEFDAESARITGKVLFEDSRSAAPAAQ